MCDINKPLRNEKERWLVEALPAGVQKQLPELSRDYTGKGFWQGLNERKFYGKWHRRAFFSLKSYFFIKTFWLFHRIILYLRKIIQANAKALKAEATVND